MRGYMKSPRKQYRVHYSIEGSKIFKNKKDAIKFLNSTPGLRIHAVFLDHQNEQVLESMRIYYAKGRLNI